MNTGLENNIADIRWQMPAQSAASQKLSSLQDKKLQAQIEETATSFEAFFLSRMMESMFEGISTDGLFGGGNAEKIYRSMLLDEYGKAMAQSGGIGVKDYVMSSILEMQEMDSKGYIEAEGRMASWK